MRFAAGVHPKILVEKADQTRFHEPQAPGQVAVVPIDSSTSVRRSSVRLLETRSGTVTTELLGLAAARVGNEEGLVILDEQFLELTLGRLVVVLLGEGDNGLGDGLTDGEDL